MIAPRTAAEQRLLTMVHEARNAYHAEAAEGEDPVAWIENDCNEIAWQAWKAGRESMREEATIACGNESLFDVDAGDYSSACLACGERITQIEP